MEKYHLKVLYPAPNRHTIHQYDTVTIIADELSYSESIYRFIKDRTTIAFYPIQYTIIEKIEEVK